MGKTLMANCLIAASGRKAFTLRKDKSDGDFLSAIQETFQKAKDNQPSIVLLDDIDKFSGEQRRHCNAEEYVTVQSCIDDAVNDDVFVVATANEEIYLPDSLVREGRLGRTLRISAPKGQDAIDIVQHFLSQKKCVADLDAAQVAKMLNGDSCAVLESVINEAGIYAAADGKEQIEMDDLIRGVLRVKFCGPENDEEPSAEFALATAYHEAGHTVVAEVLEQGSVSIVSILAHECGIGGVTDYYQSENYLIDIDLMRNRVVGLLGGKAATDIVFGKTDVGATDDIRRAHSVVGRFVDDYCATAFDAINRDYEGRVAKERKEVRVAIELENAYAKSKRILADNRAFLDAVARALVEKKTLLSSDIQRIRQTCAM